MSIVRLPEPERVPFAFLINVPASVNSYSTDVNLPKGMYEVVVNEGASTQFGLFDSLLNKVTEQTATTTPKLFSTSDRSTLLFINHAVSASSDVKLTRLGESLIAQATEVTDSTSSGSISVTAGDYFVVIVGGGGGGGGSIGSTRSGGGGGSGAVNFLGKRTLVGNEAITIGAQGTGGSTGNNGTAGGTTSITIGGVSFSASGGGGGGASGGTAGAPDGGAGANSVSNANGTSGFASVADLSPFAGTTGGGGSGGSRVSYSPFRVGSAGAGDAVIGKGGAGGDFAGGGAATGRGGGGGGGGHTLSTPAGGGSGTAGLVRLLKL